jgi:circadian clock protein KaiC
MTNVDDFPIDTLPTRTALKKSPTYIKGLDEVLEGGLPTNRTTVISGGPGSGKTLFGLEFLYRGAMAGEAGIFVSFEEPLDQLRQNAATLGWDLAPLELKNLLYIMDGRIKPDTIMTGDFSLKGLLSTISGKAKEMGAKRIFINAPVVILRHFDTSKQVRVELQSLSDWLQSCSLTAVMTVLPHRDVSFFEDFFDSMADCAIRMETYVLNQVSTRRLRVIKYRGSGFARNEHPYVITEAGLRVAPISGVKLMHERLGEKMPTGLGRFDVILAGGYRRSSCVLIGGQPGTGKTLLVSTFVDSACKRVEKVLFVSFSESTEALMGNIMSAGIQLQTHLDSGNLRFITSMPEAMGAEEHLIRLTDEIESFGPLHLGVDAISACERMGGKVAAFDYMVRLLTFCKQRGITVLLVNQTFGLATSMEISGHGIHSMVDTLIFLSYVEAAGETNRLIQVLKSRGSDHSNQKHEYQINEAGIQIMDPYVGEGDILTGAARQLQEGRDRAEYDRLAFEIQSKELEVKRLKIAQEMAATGVTSRGHLRGKSESNEQLTPLSAPPKSPRGEV